jgi:hypothetical protein
MRLHRRVGRPLGTCGSAFVTNALVGCGAPPGPGEAPPTPAPLLSLSLRNLTLTSLLRNRLVALALAGGMCAPALAAADAGTSLPTTRVETCSWDRPGVNPYTGDVVAAVDRYSDIAPDVRARLKQRMTQRAYDEVVTIRRDSITGKARYGRTIRDMHFGSRQVCGTVSRSAWSAQMQERGLVYCEGAECILVPTVCRNVSRIARAQVAHEHAEGDVPEAVPVAAAPAPAPVTLDLALTGPTFDSKLEFAAPLDADTEGQTPSGAFIPGSVIGTVVATGPAAPGSGPGIVAAVPEPETWGLMLFGMAALAAWRRRRTARAT